MKIGDHVKLPDPHAHRTGVLVGYGAALWASAGPSHEDDQRIALVELDTDHAGYLTHNDGTTYDGTVGSACYVRLLAVDANELADAQNAPASWVTR